MDGTVLISYVDDIAICIRDKDDTKTTQKAARTLSDMKLRASEKGTTFAENKTKQTWHAMTGDPWQIA